MWFQRNLKLLFAKIFRMGYTNAWKLKRVVTQERILSQDIQSKESHQGFDLEF
jgi:hypothetical protein